MPFLIVTQAGLAAQAARQEVPTFLPLR